jgi:molybdenum cofactor cytidylyltransferase
VLLAAGASRRFGRPKQLLRVAGETLVHRAARLALATQPADAVVVLGHAADDVSAELADLPLRSVICAGAHQGMGASLAQGLAALHPECAGALVVLCDQPALQAAHLQGLVALWRQQPERAVASAYSGVQGVPAVLPRAWFWLEEIRGDEGARRLLRRGEGVVTLPCEDLSRDVDTLEDFARINTIQS